MKLHTCPCCIFFREEGVKEGVMEGVKEGVKEGVMEAEKNNQRCTMNAELERLLKTVLLRGKSLGVLCPRC